MKNRAGVPTILHSTQLAIGYRQGKREKRVAEAIEIALRPGELVCLLGPNGAGKSTLMRTLIGMQPPLAGEVWLDGRPIAEHPPRELARQLGVVLTERISVGMLNGYGLVALGRQPYTGWSGRLSEVDEQKVRWAIQAVGGQTLAHRYVNELSDGERQKMMIARALAQEPQLIVLDEPTAFLDLPHRVEIMRILRQLARDEQRSILLSTHDLDLALRSADTVWLLSQDGRLRSGSPEDLVLSGAFEETFNGRGVEFDRQLGAFRIFQNQEGVVDLIGEGMTAVWTNRALARAGYEVHHGMNGAAVKVEVLDTPSNTAGAWRVTYRQWTQTADSVSELLQTLEEIG